MQYLMHTDDVRVFKAGEGFALTSKVCQSYIVVFGKLFFACRDLQILVALRYLARQVFLDGNFYIKVFIGRQIGDCKAAATENLFYSVKTDLVAALECVCVIAHASLN